MYFLIYSSYTRIEFDPAALKALLTSSRERNLQSGISGMLLYLKGKFIQFLEGEENEVKSLYNKINQDKRHTAVVILAQGIIEERLFTKWSMAYSSITAEELASGEGFEKVNSSSALQIFMKLSSKI